MDKKDQRTTAGGNKVKVDEYSYYDLALKKKEEGDLIGSLIILHNIAESGTKNLEVYATMGEIYFDIEAFTMSRECWLKYLSGSTRADVKARAYSAIGATYCMAMDNYMLGYYYDLEFALKPQKEQQYDHILYEYIDYVKDVKPEFYISSEKGVETSKSLMAEGEKAFEKGDFAAACKKFSSVLPSDEEFEESVIRVVNCKEAMGVSDEDIVLYLEEQLPKIADNGLIALLLCEKLDGKDYLKLKKYVDIAAEDEFEEPSQYCFMAGVYASLGELDLADEMIDRGLDINPYDLKCLFAKGVVAYNDGRIDESAEFFKMSYDICRDVVNEYYYKLAATGGRGVKSIAYNYRLPKEEERRILNEVAALLDDPRKIKKTEYDKLIYLAEGAFSTHSMLCANMIKAFIYFGKNDIKRYFTEKLLSQRLEDFAKVFIVEGLVLSGCTKTVAVTVDGVFFSLKLYKAYFEFGKNGVFEQAYAKAVSITFAIERRTDKVLESVYEIYEKAYELGTLKKIKDKDADLLAALVITNSKGNKITLKQAANVLSVSENAVTAFENYILGTI